MNCTLGQYIDPATLYCTSLCSAGSFGYLTTGTCLKNCPAPSYYADANVSLCVTICSLGLFANNYTQSCVVAASCYGNLVGDSSTNKCVNTTNCPTNPYTFADLLNKLCTTRCPSTYWGDTVTRNCLYDCPWNPLTYVSWKNPDTQTCVTVCP